MGEPIALYHYWRSSSSWRVRWALAIKRLAFDSIAVNLLEGEQRAETHHARNPAQYVPSLQIDGRMLSESVAIIEYLDETRPAPPLFPREPWLRARTRQIIETVNSGIQPLQNLGVLRRHAEEPARQKEWGAHYNERGLAVLEELLVAIDAEIGTGGPFAIGNTLTAADLFVVPQVYSARRFGVDVERFPRTLAAERAALATEHALAALPEHQPGATKAQ